MTARWQPVASLAQLRDGLYALAAQQGLIVDELMAHPNERFGTWNVGVPSQAAADPRRRRDGSARAYRLLGRVRAARQGHHVTLSLAPPGACDPAPNADDAVRWTAFAVALATRFPAAP